MSEKKKLFKTNEEEVAEIRYRYPITINKELKALEIEGFVRGLRKGKTMNVTLDKIVLESLHKQYLDFLKAYGSQDKDEMKRTLADLRNVAGCVFLKILEEDSE